MATCCVEFIDIFTQADLNSDGRADYLWVNQDDGAVIAYLNTGQGNEISWKAVNDGKPMAYGVGKGAGVHFGNMGGQKQVDYLLVDHDNVSPVLTFLFHSFYQSKAGLLILARETCFKSTYVRQCQMSNTGYFNRALFICTRIRDRTIILSVNGDGTVLH